MIRNDGGSTNSALGFEAFLSHVNGHANTAIGAAALLNSLADSNSAVGVGTLFSHPTSNTTGVGNTATGAIALFSNTNGNYNTSMGMYSMNIGSNGSFNSATGYGALYADNASGNTANGAFAMYNNSTGSGNVGVGDSALFSNIAGTDLVALGTGADVSTFNLVNASALGAHAIVDTSNKVVIGNTQVISIGGQVGWTSFSDQRVKDNIQANVPGLNFITQLTPVTYHYNISKENELLLGKAGGNRGTQSSAIEKIPFSGFIAQQVDSAAKNIGYDFSGVDKAGRIWGLRYADFVPSLVKSIQEQQQMIEELRRQIEAQNRIIEELRKGK
jgi:trimeric autotransporter adhesin